MFKIIRHLFRDEEQTTVVSNDIKDSIYDILNVHIVYDTAAQLPVITLELNIRDPLSEEFIKQAEEVAIFCFNLCGNNNYLLQPLLDALGFVKNMSNSHTLFVNNVLFTWEKLMKDKIPLPKEPMVKPSQVFRADTGIYENE